MSVALVEVEHPPAVAPGARGPGRPRGRWRSFLLVVVAFVMTCSMGVIVAGTAAAFVPAVAAPVVLGAARVAPSVVRAVPAVGPGAAKFGKWLAGGATTALGFVWPLIADLPERSDAEGLPADHDTQVELTTPDDESSHPGDWSSAPHAEWTITGESWTTIEYQGMDVPTLRLEGTCAKVTTLPGTVCPAPGDAKRVSFSSVHFQCMNSEGVFWTDVVSSPVMNGRQRSLRGIPPCTRGMNVDPVASMLIVPDHASRYMFTDLGPFVNPDFDPAIAPTPSVTATAQCLDPLTGARSTVSNTVEGTAAIPEVACPEGQTIEGIGWTSTVGDKVKDMGGIQHDWSSYPDCSTGSCLLRVLVDDVPCRVGIEACYDWMNVTPNARVKCEYGPYAVGLAECHDLQYGYRSGAGLTMDPARELQPGQVTRLVPADPAGAPAPQVAPGTPFQPDPYPPRAPNPDPTPTPNPTPTPTPTKPPVPESGFPGTGSNPDPPGAPIKDPETGGNCLSSMWSWNPVDWVVTPVKCALSWAFVPPAGSGPELANSARDDLTNNGLGPWLAVPPAMFASLPSNESGCKGPPLNMPASMGGRTYYPLNACHDPMARYAQMSRAIITLGVSFYGMFAIVNSLSTALVGYRMFDRESEALSKKAA